MTLNPALSRTIALPLIIPPRTTIRFPPKDPGDELDFSLDITNWLAEIDDTVESFTVSTPSASITPLTISYDSQSGVEVITAMIGGGTENVNYPIIFYVLTSSGLLLDRTIWLLVQTQTAEYSVPKPITVLPADGQIDVNALPASDQVPAATDYVAMSIDGATMKVLVSLLAQAVQGSGLAAAILAVLVEAPTSEPSEPGQLWNNGGVLSISQP
jgi:hypothetical protein